MGHDSEILREVHSFSKNSGKNPPCMRTQICRSKIPKSFPKGLHRAKNDCRPSVGRLWGYTPLNVTTLPRNSFWSLQRVLSFVALPLRKMFGRLADRFASGSECWNKAFEGGHCARMADPTIYKKSLKAINTLHYGMWTWGG